MVSQGHITSKLERDCYLHTRHSGRIPAAKGMVVGAQKLHGKCTTRQAHTHSKPRPPDPTKARATLTCACWHIQMERSEVAASVKSSSV